MPSDTHCISRKLDAACCGDGAEELVAVFVSTAATDGGDHDCTA